MFVPISMFVPIFMLVPAREEECAFVLFCSLLLCIFMLVRKLPHILRSLNAVYLLHCIALGQGTSSAAVTVRFAANSTGACHAYELMVILSFWTGA